MRKSVEKRIIKSSALFQIFLMITLTISIAVVMSESVGALDPSGTTIVAINTGNSINPKGIPSPDVIKTANLDKLTTAQKTIGSGGFETSTTIWHQDSTINKIEFLKNDQVKISGDWGKGVSKEITGGSTTYERTISRAEYNELLSKQGLQGVEPAQSKLLGFGPTVYGGWAHLSQGLTWSLGVISAIQLIGGIAGLDKGIVNSLTYASFGGIMTAKALGSLGPTGFGKGAN